MKLFERSRSFALELMRLCVIAFCPGFIFGLLILREVFTSLFTFVYVFEPLLEIFGFLVFGLLSPDRGLSASSFLVGPG